MSFVSSDFYQICNRHNNIASPLMGSFRAKVLLSSGILPNCRSIPLADYELCTLRLSAADYRRCQCGPGVVEWGKVSSLFDRNHRIHFPVRFHLRPSEQPISIFRPEEITKGIIRWYFLQFKTKTTNQDDYLFQLSTTSPSRWAQTHRSGHRCPRQGYSGCWRVRWHHGKASYRKYTLISSFPDRSLMQFIQLTGHRSWKQRRKPSRLPRIAVHHRRKIDRKHLRSHSVPRNRLPEGRWWHPIHRHLEEAWNHSRHQGRHWCCWFVRIRGWMHNSR